jgi:YHS domain-containing protein
VNECFTMNNYIKIKLEDNTRLNEPVPRSYKKGFTGKHAMAHPNQGVTEDGATIHFYNYGLYNLKEDIYAIDKKNIFMRNGKLSKKGIIVKATPVKQNPFGIEIRQQDFFQVVQSNVEDVCVGNIIIAVPQTSFRFNYKGKEYWLIEPNNIMINIKDKIESGPEFAFLEAVKDNNDIFSKEIAGCGIHENGEKYYFLKSICRLELKDKSIHIVRYKDIYAKNGHNNTEGLPF